MVHLILPITFPTIVWASSDCRIAWCFLQFHVQISRNKWNRLFIAKTDLVLSLMNSRHIKRLDCPSRVLQSVRYSATHVYFCESHTRQQEKMD